MQNITFHNPENIVFALAIPLYIVAVFISEYLSWYSLKRIAAPAILSKITRGPNETHKTLRMGVFIFVLLFLTLLLMRPRWGEYTVQTVKRNVDIVFALDISRSMLARDIYPSRLEKAKTELIEILNSLSGERASLVLFSGTAFAYVPLTHDYQTLTSFVYNIDNDMISYQGTEISKAVHTSLALLKTGKLANKKVVVIISDGETHETDLSEVIQEVNQNGIVIYALGIGTERGDWIPLNSPTVAVPTQAERTSLPTKQLQFLHDDQGRIVTSKLNKRGLTELSFLTGGKLYIPTQQTLGSKLLYPHIKKLGSHTAEDSTTFTQADKYHYLAMLLLIILCSEFILTRLPYQK